MLSAITLGRGSCKFPSGNAISREKIAICARTRLRRVLGAGIYDGMFKAQRRTMKARNKIIGATCAFGVARLLTTAAWADPPMYPPPPPPGTIVAPAPVTPSASVTVQIGVPDYYVWDGDEYVGVIGGQYYYLAPGEVWMPLPHERWEHFQRWERHHHDWREHAIRNERYRRDAHGHEYPWREREERERHEYQEHHEHHDHD